MSESRDGITLPPYTKLIPKENPGWYWVMRKGMWPKCIRTIYADKGIKPADPRDGLRMEEYTHFIGPCPEPDPIATKNIFADQKLFHHAPKKSGRVTSSITSVLKGKKANGEPA